MTVLEILLLVAGLLAFISSFFLPDGKKGADGAVSEEELQRLLDKEIEGRSAARINELTEEAAQYAVEKTERSLDRIANEKIMALGDYSDTIMTQIGNNHQEAVFLHDMLNRSKDELTELLNRAEKESHEAGKRANEAYDLASSARKLAEEVQARADEAGRTVVAAEEKMIDARRMMQELPQYEAVPGRQGEELASALSAQSVPDESVSDAALAEELPSEEFPEEDFPMDDIPADDIPSEAVPGEELSEEEMMEKILREATAELAEDISQVSGHKKKAKAKENVEEIEKEQPAESAAQEPAAEIAVQESVKKPAAAKASEEIPGQQMLPIPEKHSLPAEMGGRTVVRRKTKSTLKKLAEAEVMEGQMSIPEELYPDAPGNSSVKEAAAEEEAPQPKKEAAAERKAAAPAKPRAKKKTAAEKENTAEVVQLQFAPEKENSANHNERILEMHRMGRSNMAIAKDLGLGIGEVKLVIDLFENVG
ncbi:MAG: hypothetical protein K6E50_11235 [Lachnospiraceae bacterium]|nr:hypothetical protein [Lachnospiraceae bacterium]